MAPQAGVGGAAPRGEAGRAARARPYTLRVESSPHYFTPRPSGPESRRAITVELAGRRVEVTTADGIFCPDRLDLGTSVLLRTTPDPPEQGELLDLGCGWGPIAMTMALCSPQARVWGVDVNERALGLLADNAAAHGLDRIVAARPQDVPADLLFDEIWSNPPIRIGKPALHELLTTWLPRLVPGGTAYLVVQRNLGADSLAVWLRGNLPPQFTVVKEASAKGFRVLRVHRTLAPDDGVPA